ncbi:MAG TPA: Ig-like domain-containing protein [Steroidobacteraceae bacterium]|nr:Ig-like domain-containing protein [Steroidobacteraceae bacterium]
MSIQLSRPILVPVAASLCLAALVGGCAGNGKGLDANGNPIGTQSSAPSSAPTTASAAFQSIQDTVFTPICTRCHIGANAPEGLQLDEAHSYALLVGVPSAEVPSVLRVKAGDPANSYLIQKLQGSSGIVGVQMPFGGPYLSQSTIGMIQQWITNGAPPATATASAALQVTATMPVDRALVDAPVATIAVGFNEHTDASYLNGAVHLQNMSAAAATVPVMIDQAEANPATVLLTPLAPLGPGTYRITIHGGDRTALTSVTGDALAADYSFTFTVGIP